MPEFNPYEAPQTQHSRRLNAPDASDRQPLRESFNKILAACCVQLCTAIIFGSSLNAIVGAKQHAAWWGGPFLLLLMFVGLAALGMNVRLAINDRSWGLILAQLLVLGLCVVIIGLGA